MTNVLRMCCAVAVAACAAAAAADPAGAGRAAAAAEDDEVLSAPSGRSAGTARRTRAAAPALRHGIDDLLLEAGALPDAPEADTTASLRASAFVLWQPDRRWELRAGARLDGSGQRGGVTDFERWRADYTDTYARWRSGDTRLTFGAQTVVWGRVDAVPLIDRVSRVDLTRFLLDDLPQRRRANWAARWEQTWDDVKLDVVAMPWFRGAALPHVDSVWSPVNRHTGEVVGIAPSPQVSAVIRQASIDNGNSSRGSGGAALRLTRTGIPVDVGVTLSRARQSLPYYRFGAAGATLTAMHPYQNFGGVDAEWAAGGITWRTELGYTTGVALTRPSTAMVLADALEWVGAMEFFPGGRDTRVNLQLVARSVRVDGPTLELQRYVGVNGQVETRFAQDRWKASLRFASGLSVHDLYVGPRIAFVGWEPHEIYLAAHYFDGAARTLGGFHRDHGLITLGWRTRF